MSSPFASPFLRQPPRQREVCIDPVGLGGLLGVPDRAAGVVIVAQGSGRFDPRRTAIGAALRGAGFATLLIDLLTASEQEDQTRLFDIDRLAARLAIATAWLAGVRAVAALPVAYFGAGTSAAAALVAAAHAPGRIGAVIARGGRPDLAGALALERVQAPTQLIVGGKDLAVLKLNRAAAAHLHCVHELVVIAGARHRFEEPGAIEHVTEHAIRWLRAHLVGRLGAPAHAG